MTGRTRPARVKALARIEYVVDMDADDDALTYEVVHQAIQDALGYTGLIVEEVEEYSEVER